MIGVSSPIEKAAINRTGWIITSLSGRGPKMKEFLFADIALRQAGAHAERNVIIELWEKGYELQS